MAVAVDVPLLFQIARVGLSELARREGLLQRAVSEQAETVVLADERTQFMAQTREFGAAVVDNARLERREPTSKALQVLGVIQTKTQNAQLIPVDRFLDDVEDGTGVVA